MTVLLANAPTRIPLGGGKERFFVKAGSRWPFSIIKRTGEACRYVPFPFSLAYLAGLLEQERIDVEVFDGVALNADRGGFLDRCTSYRPSLILMEATTPTIDDDLALCRELKARTGAIIALAGAHPTVFAKEILDGNDSVSWVLKGEYELSAFSAIKAAVNLEAGLQDRLARIPGLMFRAQAGTGAAIGIREGPCAALIENLDALPFPARHMFPTRQAPSMWPYWDGFCQRRPAVQMQSSRGCPFRCNFCLWNSVIYGQGPYRTFSPARIVEEMEELARDYGAREIYFDDDVFTAKEQRVFDICDEILRRGLDIKWSVMGDAVSVSESAVKAMAAAGCTGLKFGVESASRQVLKKLGKPVKLDKVRRIVDLCAKLGVKTHATITFGLEGETMDSMRETLDFCVSLPVDSIQFSVATPFPGTEYYRTVKQEGRLVAENWSDFDGARSSVVRFADMTPEEVASFAEKAPSVWLKARLGNPGWLWRQAAYMSRIGRDQGLGGLARRLSRAADLLLNRPR